MSSVTFPAKERASGLLTWRHWAWATAIAVLVVVSTPLQNFFTNRYWAFWRVVYDMPWYLLISYTFLLALAGAEAWPPRATRTPTWRYVAAILAATLLCYAIAGAFPQLRRSAPQEVVAGQTLAKIDFADSETMRKTPRLWAMSLMTSALIQGWLAAFVYVRLRNFRRAASALADAEVERSEAQRSLLAAQLVAAHAQVDPAFVLQALDKVEREYELDPARADALLDEFIAFLRAAIPRIRAEESPEILHEAQSRTG